MTLPCPRCSHSLAHHHVMGCHFPGSVVGHCNLGREEATSLLLARLALAVRRFLAVDSALRANAFQGPARRALSRRRERLHAVLAAWTKEAPVDR